MQEDIRMTAEALRRLVGELIAPSMSVHRHSRSANEPLYEMYDGPPTDEEVDEFIVSNPLFDDEIIERLVEPGLLGFDARVAKISAEWLNEFREKVRDWSNNQTWLAADLPWYVEESPPKPQQSELWTPNSGARPGWISASSSAVLLAADLLDRGHLLSEMHWRDFERVIAELLEHEGWKIALTRGSKDGGIDVVAEKHDPLIGPLRSLWQAKKYHPGRKVQLSEVREMSAIRANEKATKAFVVTTSRLTRGAIEWIRRDEYQLGYKEGEQIEQWLRRTLLRR